MKNLKFTSFVLLILCVVSCASDDSSQNTEDNLMTLKKKVTVRTHSAYPEAKTTQIQYYANNEIVADTTFDYLDEWAARRVITTSGTTKTDKSYDSSGSLVSHREVTYDSQGRVTSRQTYLPVNLIVVSFVYNADGTVTANATNISTQITTYIATYHKNADGLIYKEFKPTSLPPIITVERTLLFDGLKPLSMISDPAGTPITFDYYTNPMPTNMTKSEIELNNEILLGLSLSKLAEEGNFYYKRNDSNANGVITTYQTNFNSNNYIEYYKSTYVNTTTTVANLLTTEVTYYYE